LTTINFIYFAVVKYKVIKTTLDKPFQGIKNRGFLQLTNIHLQNNIRIFTQSDNFTLLKSIGNVACREFGFSHCVDVQGVSAKIIKTLFKDEISFSYFMNEQNMNGVYCNGDERSILECKSTNNATYDTDLYEIEIECSCKPYLSLINLKKLLLNLIKYF
jgi:hypothetical protein